MNEDRRTYDQSEIVHEIYLIREEINDLLEENAILNLKLKISGSSEEKLKQLKKNEMAIADKQETINKLMFELERI